MIHAAQRQPCELAAAAMSGRKSSWPVALAAEKIPVTRPRWVTNQRFATIAPKTRAMAPVPVPTTRPQSSHRCQGLVITVVAALAAPTRSRAEATTRRGFLAALKDRLPGALRELQQGSIAPVDLAQAAIGPGMAVFTAYSKVVEADGSAMSVRTALALINQVLDETLSEQEGDFDADTRFCVKWFGQYEWSDAESGTADTLSRPTVNSIDEVTLASYNVRVTNSVMIGCTRRAAVNDTYTSAIAFSRTLQVLGCYTSQNTQSVNTALNGWLSDATDTANRKSTMFVEHSLDIIAYTAGGNRPMIYGATSHNSQKRVVYRNNTMLIDCEPNRDVYVFQAQFNAATANTNTMRLENNLIIKVQAGNVAAVLNANSAESLATCNATIFTPVEGNIFYLPGGTVTWSEATSIDTQAEFITAFGVRNYIAVDPGMASGRMNPQLLATGLAAQITHPLAPAATTSLNGGPWHGAGCWNPRGRALANVNLQELTNLVLQAA